MTQAVSTEPLSQRTSQRVRCALLQILVVCGGAAALSWEVVWQIQASLTFGVSALGTALTLSATMGGMALGSFAAGSWLRGRRIEHPLRYYGILEAAVGASGLFMLQGFAALERLDAFVFALSPGFAPGLHALGILILLAPPTMAMGATVPVFQKVAEAFGTRVSLLYGMNTAGAAAGVLLMTFALLPTLGIQYTCILVAALNFAIFIASRLFGESNVGPVLRTSEPKMGGTAQVSLSLSRLLVFATGFATFGLEVAWFRAMRCAFWSTSATFAIILASVLIPLAIGARLVPWMRRHGISPGSLLVASGAAILLATPLVERLDLAVFPQASYVSVILRWFVLSTVIVGPPVLLLATVLPWCLEEYPEPRVTGQLYAVNTVGSVVGSLVTAWVLLPTVGFARSAWIMGLVILSVSILVAGRRSRVPGLVAGAVSMVLAVQFTSSPGRERAYGQRGSRTSSHVVAMEEGPDFTVSVVSLDNSDKLGNRLLVIDGFLASSEHLAAGLYMEWMGSLPVLLHPNPQRALVICFGTGRTANAVRQEDVPEVDVVDVSGAVLSMAKYFPTNEGVLEDPRVNPVVMDGRAWLRRTDRSYDVVTLEPMPPNFSGVNALYSREFYEIVKKRLRPGGVVAQWLPFHLVTPEHAFAIAATFVEAFPDSVLWVEPFGGTGILLGREIPNGGSLSTSWPGLVRRPVERILSDEQIRRAVALDAGSLAAYARRGEVITDDNQLLAWGQIRSGEDPHAVPVAQINRQIVTLAASWPVFSLDWSTPSWDAPGPAGPRRISR